jgi:hypothetical protein
MLLAKPTRFLDHIPSHFMEVLGVIEEGRSHEWDADYGRYG